MTDPKPNPAEAMMAMVEQLSPLFEAATGLRRKLEADGWSPTMAESIAGDVVAGLLRKAFS